MEKDPDPQIGPERPEQGGDELEVVVLDPDPALQLDRVGGRPGEALVDRDVRRPPVVPVGRLLDGVVVQRPDRPVAQPLVVATVLRTRDAYGDLGDPVQLEGLGRDAGPSVPADPGPSRPLHDRDERRHQAAGAPRPPGTARGVNLGHGEAICHHGQRPATGVQICVHRVGSSASPDWDVRPAGDERSIARFASRCR